MPRAPIRLPEILSQPPLRGREGRATLWRAAWVVGVALSATLLSFSPTGLSGWAVLGLGCAVVVMLIGLALPQEGRWRAVGVSDWAIAGLLAALFTGGVTGPLAVWCLLPVAGAAMTGGPQRLAAGAALSAASAAVVAVAELAGLVGVAPPESQGFWLSALALVSTSLGLGVGLIVGGREAAAREETRAREARALLRLLEAQPNLLFSARPSGKVRKVWGAAIEGVPSNTLMRDGLAAIAAPEDAPAIAAAFVAAGRDGASEVILTPRQAQDRAVAASFRRLGEDQVVVALRDATAEQSREASLDQQRLEAEARAAGRSRFLANMSHELRTPLNAIMGFSDIMRARMFGPLEGRYGEYAELIHESGRHLLDLISDLLDMSKIEAERYQLDREIFDAREAINAGLRLMRIQADAAGVVLRGVMPAAPLEIDADRRALKQMVLNLVSNAVKFTPKGGVVTVTAHAYDGRFELIVADTGVGISPEDLERLGRPFEQAGDSERRALGSGLGLSLVRAFAELHGGEMQIESRLGAGTSVTVRLPAPMEEAVAPPPAPTAPAFDHHYPEKFRPATPEPAAPVVFAEPPPEPPPKAPTPPSSNVIPFGPR